MVNNISSALSAYQTALNRINNTQPATNSAAINKPQNSFTEVLQNTLKQAVDTQKQAEITTIKGISGQADIQDVVLAISNAQQALETVVAVRDTAIKAYNSIMQMNI